MKKNPVDDLFARKLRQAEIEPRDETWTKLQNRLQTKERRLVVGWQKGAWLAAAGLSLLLVSGWVLWNNRSPQPATIAQVLPVPTVKKIPIGEAKPDERTVGIANNLAVNQPISPKVLSPKTNSHNQLRTKKEASIEQSPDVRQQIETAKLIEKEIEKPLLIAPSISPNAVAQTSPPVQKTVVMQLPEIPVVASVKSVIETTETPLIETAPTKNNRKTSRFARLMRQLKNVKQGERVDWDEVGVHPDKLLAKVTRKTEENTSENK